MHTAKPYRFNKADLYFVETIANLGVVALENPRAYEIIQKNYETFRREMIQWHAELGDEWLMGEIVKPPEEHAIKIPREDKIKQSAEA